MDQTTELLSSFACNLEYGDLSPQVVHQVKRTVVDTLGCAVGGFHSEPATIARNLAGSITSSTPSRILGTQIYSSPDMAEEAGRDPASLTISVFGQPPDTTRQQVDDFLNAGALRVSAWAPHCDTEDEMGKELERMAEELIK